MFFAHVLSTEYVDVDVNLDISALSESRGSDLWGDVCSNEDIGCHKSYKIILHRS